MSLIKLRMAMAGTLTLIIGLSTLFFAFLLYYFANPTGISGFVGLGIIVVLFNLVQWLLAPYLIGALYHVKAVTSQQNPKLYQAVQELSVKNHIKPPKVMIADIPIPNAFAYGSPLTGSRVAVTSGLMNKLEWEEVEAVIGHELGHLRHRDVQIMMFVSVLPAIFYFIGQSLLWSTMYSGGSGRSSQNGGGAALAAVGGISLAAYFILNLFILGLSRLREYYADRNSASTVDDGARKLSEALAKIVTSTGRMKAHPMESRKVGGLTSFRTLFIADPNRSETDAQAISGGRYHTSDQELVREIASRKLTGFDRVMEIFSTHPNVVKRIRALQELS